MNFKLGILLTLLLLFVPSILQAEQSDTDKKLEAAVRANEIEAVRKLLENGAEPNAKDVLGISPFAYSVTYASREVVILLLQHNSDVNSEDILGRTPIFKVGDASIVELLVSNGADVHHKDRIGATALTLVECLAAPSDPKVQEERRKKIVEALRKAGAKSIGCENLR